MGHEGQINRSETHILQKAYKEKKVIKGKQKEKVRNLQSVRNILKKSHKK